MLKVAPYSPSFPASTGSSPTRPASPAAFSPQPSSASLQPTLVFYFSPDALYKPLVSHRHLQGPLTPLGASGMICIQ